MPKKIHLFYTHRISPGTKSWSGGTTANEQISWNFYRRATERGFNCSVHYFGDKHIRPADNQICICHPGSALENLAKTAHRNLYMICPWSSYPKNLKSGGQHVWIKPQFDAVRKIFGLGGEIWKRKAADPDNPYHKWYKKLHLSNMGVDANRFENWKGFKFNKPGKRGFLFMGSPTWWKGINEIKACFKDKPYHIWLCGEGQAKDLAPNIHYLGMVNNNGPTLKALFNKIDFYLQMSVFDAQATTILENVAHGLVPVCTPESGFNYAIDLHPTNEIEANRKLLDEIQNYSNEKLVQKSQKCLNIVKTQHSWDKIVDRILDVISTLPMR